ncbi:MAG: tetraacyldisaccharide 4'-kinase [Candidatus Gastranaerophilales bacterium]|nr:tetraacyldisaccharide 4'-kinase [Candidatus Gastranaerophilales bacterium]
MKNFVAHIHYAKYLMPEERLAYFCLGFLKIFYSLGANAKLLLYKFGIKKPTKVDAFVISIGNITTGGTGKTPVCVAIANYFSETKNQKTAILSRGYGGKLSNSQVNTISDGENIFFSAHMSGDEPYWLAYNSQKTAVLTCKNRIEAAKTAIKDYNSEVLILDDGFQHIKLHRDLNIMLIDGNLKFGNGKLLPQGPLREPLKEISRADVILIMNKRALDTDAIKNCEDFKIEIENKYQKRTYVCNFVPKGIFNLQTNEELTKKSKVYAFAGIGQPKFFFEYLKNQGFENVKERIFEDHHLYTKEDIKNIVVEAKKLGATSIITTEKDAVKIKALLDKNSEIGFYALKLGLDIDVETILG